MKILLKRIWHSPRLSRIILALCMPAMVTIGFAPGWAIALCAGTLLLSIIFMYAEVLSPKFIQQTNNGKTSVAAPAQSEVTVKNGTIKPESIKPVAEFDPQVNPSTEPVPALLKAWADYGYDTATALAQSQNEIREAIRMSTSSAIEVGHCVQQVQANHDTQVLLARQLLESTESGPEENRTLADLAGMAAEALDHQSKQMALTAENAFYLVERQQMASLLALRVDDLLADADKAAKELAMAALSSKDGAAHSNGQSAPKIDPLAFSKTYRNTIRELRTGLDAIRQSLAQATNDLQNNVNQLKGAANLGRAEVGTVARSIQTKLSETQLTMKRLTNLSFDTDNHIRNAVVAMQYHDITTQKLAAVEANKLQSLLAHTQTMVANSNRQFPHLTVKPHVNTVRVATTEASDTEYLNITDLAEAAESTEQPESAEQPEGPITAEKKPVAAPGTSPVDLFQ